MLLKKLNESADINPLIQEIVDNCGQYLSQVIDNPSNVLLRGMSKSSDGKLPIRTDRRPLTSKYIDSAIFNIAFEERFGVENIRSKTLFCSTSPQVVKQYGLIHLVFPVDGTKCVYNPRVKDSLVTVIDLAQSVKFALKTSGQKMLNDFETLADGLKGNVSISDLGNLKSIVGIIEQEAAYTPKFAGIKLTDNINVDAFSDSTEVGLFGKPYCYVISLATVSSILGSDMVEPSDFIEYMADLLD